MPLGGHFLSFPNSNWFGVNYESVKGCSDWRTSHEDQLIVFKLVVANNLNIAWRYNFLISDLIAIDFAVFLEKNVVSSFCLV